MDDLISADRWLRGLLDLHLSEIETRGLHVHFDGDEGIGVQEDPRFEIDFVFETVPDGCEIYLAASRHRGPVTRVGAIEITLRWQIERGGQQPGQKVVPIRRRPFDSRSHLNSAAVKDLSAAFDSAHAVFRLDSIRRDEELIARAIKAA